MKIACIDDVPGEGEALLSLVTAQLTKYKLTVGASDYYASGDSFFRSWHPGMYRLILLDILLSNESGIDIARTIRRIDPRVLIVFCSSSNEFASESYAVRANYYLTKPVREASVAQMILQLNLLKTGEEMIELPDHRMLPVSQFLYSEYHNHLITIHLKNGSEVKLWSSQADFQALLEPFGTFLPVNPGTVIHLKEVTGYDDSVFRLSDGSAVPYSRRKKKELLGTYQHYLFAELRKAL